MTYAPETILAARAFLKRQDADLNDNEVGIVGGPSHIIEGTSYHLGADQLKMSRNPYSARTPRDRSGLSNAASALDVDDDLDELRQLSVWCVEQCRTGAPDTLDIREIIYSPNGVTVMRWDRERGQASQPIPDSDLSHRSHTHFSYYRDSEFRDKVGLFRRFFGGTPDMMFIQIAGQTEVYKSDGFSREHVKLPRALLAAQKAGYPIVVVGSLAEMEDLGGPLRTDDPSSGVSAATVRAIVRAELDLTKLGPAA